MRPIKERVKKGIPLDNKEAVAKAINKATGRRPRFGLYETVSKHEYAGIGFVVALVLEGLPLHYAIGVSSKRYKLLKRRLRSLADQALDTDEHNDELVQMINSLHDWNINNLQNVIWCASDRDRHAVQGKVDELVAELRDAVNGILSHLEEEET